MAALHFPVAQQQNANVAGLTGGDDTPTAHPLTAAEHFIATVSTEAGGLGYLFGHSYADAVATPLETATNAVRGLAGGLVPSHDTNVPGTFGTVSVDGVKTTLSDRIATGFASIRKAVGI
jgi:hypothetical protein